MSDKSQKSIKWVLRDEKGLIRGPYSTSQILKYIQEGIFLGSEMISRYPDGSWTSLSQEPEFYDKLFESLQQQVEPPPSEPLPEETIFMKPPPRKKELPLLAPVEEQSPKISLLPEAEATRRLSPLQGPEPISLKNSKESKESNEQPILDLEDVKVMKRKKVKKKTLGPALLLMMMILGGILLLWPSGDEAPDKISLLVPQKGGQQLGPEAVKERLTTAVRAIERDTFEDLLEAQNKLVSIIEGAPSDLEARGLLCYVYKELWPYAKQDAADLKAISGISQSTRVLNIASPNGIYCEAVKLYTFGKYKEARGTIESILETNDNFSLLPIVFQFKAEIIEGDKDLINSIPYYEKAGQIWSPWIKPKVSLGFALTKNNQGPQAAEAFRSALAKNKNHKLAKVGLGLLDFKLFNQTDSALASLSAGLEMKSRIPRLIESEALFSIAKILNQKGEQRRALGFAEKAHSLNPSNDAIKKLVLRLGGKDTGYDQVKNESISLGDQFVRAGDFFSAQAEYKTAFELDPKNGTAAFKAAKSLWQINQSYEAIEWLKKAMKADPKLTAAFVLQADYLSQRFDFGGASQILNEINRQNPNNYEILRGMALLEFRKNNMKGAINFGVRSLKVYDADIDTYIILARASRILSISLRGGTDVEKRDAAGRDAIRYATKAVELDSTNADAQIAYAEMIAATSGIDTGAAYLQELIKKYSFSNEYKVALGDLLRVEERYSQAREIYERVTLSEQKNKKALLGLGICYKALGLNDAALISFMNAALADPTDAEPLFQAAIVYQETHRYEEAMNQFKRVVKINPYFPRTHYYIGKTAFLLGNLELALAEVKEEKKNNPNVAESYTLAAEINATKHQYSECATEYSIAMKLRPQGAEIYVKAAQCYRQSGSVEIAEDMLGLAEKRESGYAEIYREQGAIFQIKGDVPAAVRSFQKYLELAPNAPDKRDIEGLISKLGG
jgi:tetratricopeptide (TPR) repeat protein